MANNNDVGASVSLDTAAYTRNIAQAIRSADNFDAALDDVIGQINKTDKALDALNTDVKMTVDADFTSLLDADSALQKLDTSVTAMVNVDDGDLLTAQRLLEDFNSSYTPKLNVDDSELKQAQKLLDDIDAQDTNTKINVEDDELTQVQSKLEQLQQLAVINLAVNLAGSIPSPADVPILGAIIEADKASRTLAANIGMVDAPNIGLYQQQAQDLYTNNFGGSQTEAAGLLLDTIRLTRNETGEATKTFEEFDDVAAQALTTATLSGEDFNAVLDAADKLVSTGLVTSYTEAFDLINTGFQEGLNRGDDFLDTIREYSGQFEDLGYSATDFFSVLKRGLDSGAYNTDFIADLLKEANIRAQAAIAGEGVEFDAISALGMLDEAEAFQAGEISGKEYIDGLLAAIESGIADGSVSPQTVFDALGTKAEDLTLETTLGLQGGTAKPFEMASGATARASDELFGGLPDSIETAKRLIETELATSINDAFDIQGKVDTFNEGIKRFSALLASGEDIPAAIEEAFNLDGFAETFARFESAIGNLVIEVGNLIASILDATGNTDAAAGTREFTTGLAEQQLAFDLKLQDDGAGMTSAVQTAIRRGVSEAGLEAALTEAGMELIAEGDLIKAQTFVNALREVNALTIPADVAEYLSGKGIDPTNLQAVKTELESIVNTTTNIAGIEIFKNPFKDTDPQALLGGVDAALLAQNAATPIVTEFDNAISTQLQTLFDSGSFLEGANLSTALGLTDMASVFNTEMATVFSAMPDLLETQMTMAAAPVTDFSVLTNTNLDTIAGKVDEIFPGIGQSITDNMITPLGTVDANVTGLATTVTAQAPIITTALGGIQTESAATGLATETLGTDVQTLDGQTLSSLVGQFAYLRLGIEENVAYATEQVRGLIGAVTDANGLVITMGSEGGRANVGSNLSGGLVQSGEVSRVHGNEMLIGAPQGVDVSVLNQQSTAVLEGAVAAMMGGSGGGGSVYNDNRTINYVIASGAEGFANADATAIRGF